MSWSSNVEVFLRRARGLVIQLGLVNNVSLLFQVHVHHNMFEISPSFFFNIIIWALASAFLFKKCNPVLHMLLQLLRTPDSTSHSALGQQVTERDTLEVIKVIGVKMQ